MEAVHHHQGRRNICREMSPDRAKRVMSRPTFKKVQVVYYISRNGNLEHPHYIEVTHLAHQHLRLKDVLERLTVLRGKEMASLYSWSCKRSYKNGYVWNDLSENDAIFPSEGAEYVLKGSELVAGCTEKLNNLRVGNVQQFQDSGGFHPKRKPLPSKRLPEHHELLSRSPGYNPEEEEEEYAGKAICSRGVSTDEVDEFKHQEDTQKINNHTPTEFTLDHTNPFPSPPSTTSSTHSDNSNTDHNNNDNSNKSNIISKRFEDGDPVENEPMLSRNSMLFNLIACGGSTSFRKMNLPPVAPPRKSGSGGSLQKEAVSRAAGKAAAAAESEDQVMISYMSENPRIFGSMQSEEKEYFSGSIVEAIANEERFGAAAGPGLKKSSSYNQERSMKAGLGEVGAAEEEEVKKDKGMKGKCIPRKKSSSSSKKPKK